MKWQKIAVRLNFNLAVIVHRDGDGDGDGHDETAAPQYSPYSYADDDKEGGRNAHQ